MAEVAGDGSALVPTDDFWVMRRMPDGSMVRVENPNAMAVLWEPPIFGRPRTLTQVPAHKVNGLTIPAPEGRGFLKPKLGEVTWLEDEDGPFPVPTADLTSRVHGAAAKPTYANIELDDVAIPATENIDREMARLLRQRRAIATSHKLAEAAAREPAPPEPDAPEPTANMQAPDRTIDDLTPEELAAALAARGLTVMPAQAPAPTPAPTPAPAEKEDPADPGDSPNESDDNKIVPAGTSAPADPPPAGPSGRYTCPECGKTYTRAWIDNERHYRQKHDGMDPVPIEGWMLAPES